MKDFKNILPPKILVSSYDLRQMFFSIPVAHDSRKFFNFWFDGEVLTQNRLPMGVRNSIWVGQRTTNITYSDVNLVNFLKMKGLTLGSKEFPYK